MLNKSFSYSDEIVLQVIKEDNRAECDKVLKFLYQKYYPQLRNYIINNSGEENESKDIFQEVLITFYMQVKEGKYLGKSTIGTYLYSIGRNVWLKELRKRKVTYVEVKDNDAVDESTLDSLLNVRGNLNLFTSLFEQLKDGCRTILQYAYYQGLSTLEMKDKLSLGSEQAVRTKKFRCLQRLNEIFKKNKISKDHFTI